MGGSCGAFWLREVSDRTSWVCLLLLWTESRELGCSLMEVIKKLFSPFPYHILLLVEIIFHWPRCGPLLHATECCLTPCSSHVSVWCGKLLGDKQWTFSLYWIQICEKVFLLTLWLWSVDPRGHKLCPPMKVQRRALSLNLRNSGVWPHIRAVERVSSVSEVFLQNEIVTIECIKICKALYMRGKETWINRDKRK